LLEVKNVSKRYRRGTWALRDIDLALEPGGVVGLVGPNGAGKSTLLKLWVGFERATTGVVTVMGLDAWRQRQATLSRGKCILQSVPHYQEEP
jgi:ABC-type multidrug transport system ATPase subunit